MKRVYGRVSRCFDYREDAAEALDNMHHAELYGKVLNVNIARPMGKFSTRHKAGKIVYTSTGQTLAHRICICFAFFLLLPPSPCSLGRRGCLYAECWR